MLKDLVLQNRTYRSFDESKPITKEIMVELVDLARQTASGMNKQPLRYRILTEQADLDKMMQNCRFGGALPNMKLPPEGKKPTGFILIFADKEVASPATLALKDVGIAAQTILLGATEQGFGGCMLASFNAERMIADFGIDARYEPQLAIALGTPAEKAVIVESFEGAPVYYRDENGTHCVPKKKLEDIII